jgi:predicted amidohydrolase YtcJ
MHADLIVTGAHVLTLDAGRPVASALAVRRGVIEYVGEDAGAVAMAGPGTERVDLSGAGARVIVPGFIDSHLHLMWYGKLLVRQADLVGCGEVEEIVHRLGRLRERRLQSGGGDKVILQGHGFDQEKLAEKRFPTRRELDAAFGGQAVFISRVCGHAGVANSAMISLVAGRFPAVRERSANSDPETGLYSEDCLSWFYRSMPALTDGEMAEAILAAGRVALSTGITSVQTLLDTPEQFRGYTLLEQQGKLPVRVVGIPPFAAVESLHALGLRSGYGNDMLRLGQCKFFADGSLGARTAYLSGRYADDAANPNVGTRMYEPGDLKAKCREAQRRGFGVAIHAIGDAALDDAVGAIEHALDGGERDNGFWRHRVEHASVTRPDQLARMVRRGIVTTLQPQFVTSDTWTGERLGKERLGWAYPFRDMQRAGLPITLSSDCPVEKLDAFDTLAAAVEGHEWRDGGGPENLSRPQTLTPAEALRAYCLGSAYAGGVEGRVGSLSVGKCADFVVLSDNPLTTGNLRGMKAERVYLGGKDVTVR